MIILSTTVHALEYAKPGNDEIVACDGTAWRAHYWMARRILRAAVASISGAKLHQPGHQ
jgi:hypothetical protein